jgi:F-type H+-transporting ATPase subunit epsilon
VPFDLNIVTPQGPAYSGSVESVVLPGSEGDFGVLASHERLLAPLRIGVVEIRGGDGLVCAAIASGFAEVDGEKVVVMVESCECAADVDVARAELARDRSEQQLADKDDETRRRDFTAALARARNRLAVAERGRS